MRGSKHAGTPHNDAFLSLAGILFALLVLTLAQVTRVAQPPMDPPPVCAIPPPLIVSLPLILPGAASAPSASPTATALAISPTAGTPSPSPTPSASVLAASPAGTPAVGTETPTPPPAVQTVATRLLFRADDPPADHGLAISYASLMPAVIPVPCQVPATARRSTVLPCIKLLPPAARLCASGIAGEGRLSNEAPASAFALQADRITLTDLDGNTRIDALQGYFRYDDPDRGLQLLCPQISYVESVSSNALRFIALCSNRGADGWAVSGQATDGGISAVDSLSFTIDAPDGTQTALVGSVPVGGLLIRDAP